MQVTNRKPTVANLRKKTDVLKDYGVGPRIESQIAERVRSRFQKGWVGRVLSEVEDNLGNSGLPPLGGRNIIGK